MRGKSKEEVAHTWWKQIKKEMPFECEMEKVSVGGEDITGKVKELEKGAPLE